MSVSLMTGRGGILVPEFLQMLMLNDLTADDTNLAVAVRGDLLMMCRIRTIVAECWIQTDDREFKT